MAQPIIFKITQAGKTAALGANGDGAELKINLTQVAIGAGKYTPTGNEITLMTEVGTRSGIVSGDVEVSSNTLRFSSSLTMTSETPIYEIGLFTDDGVLFAVAASITEPLLTIYPGVTFVAAFGLSLSEVGADNVTVTTDPNGALSIVLMQQHLAAIDPHPQYLTNHRFQLLLSALIPIGYVHHTHIPVNPKPLFDELLGVETFWRRIVGRMMIATDPNDPFINDYGIILGQKSLATLATSERPHIYPLQTTHIFERYDPAAVIETVWTVKSNKVAIGEGEAVRFTVSANNLPDGQILTWTAKEGLLNAEQNDIDVPEKTDSGTVVLKNGQAVIDFITTPDDNEVEPLKYVRLTVGVPASLSINVPITDKGFNEIVINITQSTNSGIVLDEYYKTATGAYPLASDEIRFVVANGVDIVAPDTATPAMQDGVNWQAGSQVTIENRGRILGRGGNGGRSAEWHLGAGDPPDTISILDDSNWSLPTKGGDGGIAISSDFNVNNYGVISGGGGGGGGAGALAYRIDSNLSEGVYEVVGGGGSGGGAPYGNREPNANTIESFYKHYVESSYAGFDYSKEPQPMYMMQLETASALAKFYQWYSPAFTPVLKTIPLNSSASTLKNATFFLPQYLEDGLSYHIVSYGEVPNVDTSRPFITYESAKIYHNYSVPLKQSSNGGATIAGKGGYGGQAASGVNADSELIIPNYFENIDFTAHHGGDGGDVGVNGMSGVNMIKESIKKLVGNNTGVYAKLREIPPAPGGLAGYVSEGNVTINNIANGTTKGRTAP